MFIKSLLCNIQTLIFNPLFVCRLKKKKKMLKIKKPTKIKYKNVKMFRRTNPVTRLFLKFSKIIKKVIFFVLPKHIINSLEIWTFIVVILVSYRKKKNRFTNYLRYLGRYLGGKLCLQCSSNVLLIPIISSTQSQWISARTFQ